MQVYQLDRDGFYVGTTSADPSPLEPGKYLIPGGCVTTPPPTVGPNQAARYTSGAWGVVPNYSGTTYWLADGAKRTMEAKGVPLPAGATTTKPQPTLTETKAAKMSALDTSRAYYENIPVSGNTNGKQWSLKETTDKLTLMSVWIDLKSDIDPMAERIIISNEGDPIPFTLAWFELVMPMLNTTKENALRNYFARKTAVANAATISEVNAVNADLGA